MLFSCGNCYCLRSTAVRTLLRLTACCTASGRDTGAIVYPFMVSGSRITFCFYITANRAFTCFCTSLATRCSRPYYLIIMGTSRRNCTIFTCVANRADSGFDSCFSTRGGQGFDPISPYMITSAWIHRRNIVLTHRHRGRHQTDHHGQRQQDSRQLLFEKSLHRFSLHKSSHLTGTNQ